MILLNQVDFGEDEEDGAVDFADEAEEEFVFAGPIGPVVFWVVFPDRFRRG